MNKIKMITTALVPVLLLGMPAFAEPRMQGPGSEFREEGEFAPDQGPGGPPSEERREEVRKKIEAIRIWRLTEELNLDPNISGRLSALLSSHDQRRREIQKERRESMISLRRLLDTQKPEEAKIKNLLEKLESSHRAMQELKNSELKSVKDILTIEQQARFVLFQNEFQREMRAMIGNARGGMGRGPMDGPGGPDQRPRTRGQGKQY